MKTKQPEPPMIIDCKVIATWNTGLTKEITTGSNQFLDTFLEGVEYTEQEDNWNLCEGCFEYVHIDYTYSCGAEIIVDHNICKKCKEHV